MQIRLVDTAGWRANQKSALYAATKAAQEASLSLSEDAGDSQEKRDTVLLEGMSVNKAFKALSETHVGVLLVDISALGVSSVSKTKCISSQDVSIAGKILEEGKPLVIVVNKMDKIKVVDDPEARKNNTKKRKKSLAEEKIAESTRITRAFDSKDQKKMQEWIAQQFAQSVPQSAGCSVICISAQQPADTMVDDVMRAVIEADRRWRSRVPTPKLCRWIQQVMVENPPASAKNVAFRSTRKVGTSRSMAPIPVKLKYMTQVSARPPTFAVFVNRHNPEGALDESYKRYLVNKLKADYDLHGVPLRILVRSSGNPFMDPLRPRKPKAEEEEEVVDESNETEFKERKIKVAEGQAFDEEGEEDATR